MNKRFFSTHQRLAAFAAEGGRCALCGVSLDRGFHADHVVAFANGGVTDVENLQGLCVRCNARKGARRNPEASRETAQPPPLPPWTKPLRSWQEKGFVEWRRMREADQKDVLATACPGSGKSIFACRLIHEELTTGRADRIVIVVPGLSLKAQWAAVAQAHGVRLAASWGNDAVTMPMDVHGVIVTYAQVARLPEVLRMQCARHRVFVAFDEIHHGGDGLSWGKGIREAFEHAQARLSLSGTAWRSDAAAIPFVTYDDEGNSVADIRYDYAQALADGVVRETFFFTTGGQVRWLEEAGERQVTFDDELEAEGVSRRLRAALDTRGEWLPAVIRQANSALADVRLGHPDARAFVVCMDAAHARAVAGLLERVTGERPALALGDDPGAGATLEAFRHCGSPRWLVVCRLAGEGYDAPNLRVCVWATHAAGSELFFRQVTARTIRMMKGLDYQDALTFLPSDPRLLAMAQSILTERARALGGPQQDREARAPGARSGGRGRPLFVPLESKAAGGVVLSGGVTIPSEALEKANAFKVGKQSLAHMPAHAIAAVFAHLEPHQMPQFPAACTGATADVFDGSTDGSGKLAEPDTYDELRLQKRRLCSRLVATVARASGEAIEAIHRACHQGLGVRQGDASLADLERKEAMLKDRLVELGRAH